MSHVRRRCLPLLSLALVLAATLAHAPSAAAADPCFGGNPPDYCFDTHTASKTVHLYVTPPSSGSVTSTPAGISCGQDCTEPATATRECSYNDIECSEWNYPSFQLTASGGPNGYAPQWTGCASPSEATCTVTVTGESHVSLSWVDVTDPVLSSLSVVTAGNRVGRTAVVGAAASDNSAVAKVQYFVDSLSTPVLETASAGYAGGIDLSGAAYADGTTHTISARAVDTWGRQSSAVSRTVTVDKHVSVSAGSVPSFAAQPPSVTVATDSDATLRCALDGGTPSTCSGAYAPAVSGDGTHTYGVTAVDDVGNTASVTRTFVLDSTAPAVVFTGGPGEGQEIASSTPTVSFSATDANLDTVRCRVDSGAMGSCTTPSSETPAGLAPGAHQIAVLATDRAGRQTQAVRTFSVRAPSDTGQQTAASTETPVAGSGAAPVATVPRSAATARLTAASRRAGAWTTFTTLLLRSVPPGASIRVTCQGKGCPKRVSARPAHGVARLTALLHRRLGVGVRITIRITRPDAPVQTIRITVRRGRAPKVG